MRHITNTLTLIIILSINTFDSFGQADDLYKVTLRRYNNKELILYDTIIHLDYLIQNSKNYEGVTNFEFFQQFNYPALDCIVESTSRLILTNDTIRIIIESKDFDTLRFKRNLKTDPDYYLKHPFFGIDGTNLTDKNLHLPKSELSRISISINKNINELPYSEYENLFNPNFDYQKGDLPAKGYVTNNGKIIIQMENGRGAGFYYAIFLFDSKGNLNRRVVKNVL